MAESPEEALLRPAVAAQAEALVQAAERTLDRLADDGWSTLLGAEIGGEETGRLGADAVVDRSEAFDPLA
jgi:hypothetical protein